MFKHADGALLVVAALLAACGGSSSSPPPPPPERVALYAGMPGRDPAISGGLVDGPRADARFSLGVVIAAGPEGNLYVADIDNHAIRKITPQGVVSTLLVRNVPGEDLRTIAVDSAGVVHFGVATCTDSSDHRTVLACQGAIYRISPTLQAEPVIPLASSDGSTTSLFYPGSLAFDRSGNLYISDQNLTAFTCAVRRLTPAGEISNSPAPCGNLRFQSADGRISDPRQLRLRSLGQRT